MLWKLFPFFWVIPQVLNFVCRRLEPLCSISVVLCLSYWKLFPFFWVIPQVLNFVCRRFEPLCSISVVLCLSYWKLFPFFWVIPQVLNIVCRRLEPLCSISVVLCLSYCSQDLWRSNRQCVPERRHINVKRLGITQKKEYNIYGHCQVGHRREINTHI